MAGALARAATMPFKLAAKGAKAAARGVGKAASRAGSSVRRGSARVRRTATSARRNVRRTYRRQVRSRFRGRSGGGRTRSNRSGSRPRNRSQRRSGRNTRDRGSNRDRNRRQSSGREGFDNNGSQQQQQQQQQRPQSEYREKYRRGRQGIDYRFAGNGFLPGVATGVILGGTTTTAFYPGSQQTTPYYGGGYGGGGGGYYPANPQQSFYSPQQQGQGQGQYYPPSPFSSSSQYPPVPVPSPTEDVENEKGEDVQEPEDVIEQAPRAPFSPEELKSLALHNAIPHRRIKSLIAIEGPLLLDFVKASNDFLAEPNPRKQVSKGITMVKMAEKMDLRFGTHALGWVKAVRNRPRGWSLLHAFRYADALTEEQIIEISDMDDAKVPDYLTDTTVELDDTYTEPLSIDCKMGKRPSGSSSSSSSSSSANLNAAEEDISLTSSVKDRFCIFYRRHRKVLVFHLNGLVEGYSYIDSKTAKGNNVPRMITISEVPFTRMTAAETRCEHLRMFSQARLLATLSNLLSQGSPLLAGGGGGGGVGQESVRDVIKNPKTNVGSIYGFSTGFELTSRVHPLVPLALSEDQMKEYRFGIKEMSTFNNTIKALVEVVNSHQAVVEKLFVGSTRFSSSIGNLK